MKRILFYLKPYWLFSLLAPACKVLEAMTDLLQPTVMSRIVDIGIAGGDMGYVVRNGFWMLGVAALGILGGVGCVIFSTIASGNMSADMRRDLYSKVQSFSLSHLDRFSTGTLITRLTNDITQVQNTVSASMRVLIRAPLLCVGGMISAVSLNRDLGMVFLVSVPILAVGMALVLSRGIPMYRVVQKKLDRINIIAQENLSAARVVKAFVRAEHERNRFETANRDLTVTNLKVERLMALTSPLMNLIMNLSVVAVLLLGTQLKIIGKLEIGQLMAFINYMTQILFALMMSSFVFMNVARAKASLDRISEVFSVEPDLVDEPGAPSRRVMRGSIDFENVSFRYTGAGGEDVLSNLELHIRPGEFVAILGGTGSGKSTLIHLVPRLYEATSGRVLVDGVDVRKWRKSDLRKGIGIVQQEAVLFTGRGEENLLWGADAGDSEPDIGKALRNAQAEGFVDAMPEGRDSLLGRRGVNVSGGQKQRLTIARALLGKKPILILDDATSAVDMRTEELIQQAIRTQNCTVLLVAQRVSTVMDADRIVLLEHGRISAVGTHEELLASSALYREIVSSQLGKVV